VEVDVEARLGELSLDLLDTLDRFHPCGMHNPDPVFWSRAVRVVKQQTMGKTKEHVKFSFSDGKHELEAVAWRWASYLPLPETVDIAYKLQENIYQGKRSLQLSLEGVRPASARAQRGRRNQQRGIEAEEIACRALSAHGWRIMARRLRTLAGEIDAIAEKDGVMAIIEVKARASLADAAEALSARQSWRLLRAAELVIADNPGWGTCGVRVDLLAVDPAGRVRRIADAVRLQA